MLRSLSCALLVLCGGTTVRAQEVRDDSTDNAPPPRAFSMVEARRFAGVLALGGLAYLADDAARTALRSSAPSAGVGGALNRFGYYYGDPGVSVLSAAMWGTGLLANRPVLARSGLRGMEAIAVSGLVTTLLKGVAGRARPDVGVGDRDDWRLMRGFEGSGQDYRSAPSGHATVAFAFATAMTAEVARSAPRAARAVGLTTFGLAGLTSWQRMHDDRHWLSDVTVGGGIGVVTALAITRWHATRPQNVIDRWFLRPATFATPRGDMAVGLSLVPGVR